MTTSMGSVPPPSSLSYTGEVVVPFISKPFSPQTTFNTFSVPTIWINTAISGAWILVSKALGVAVWVPIGGSPGEIDTITTPDSTVVVPTAGNINFLQSGSIAITGSGSDITFNVTGGGLSWIEVTGTSASLAANTGYIANNGGLVTLTLPTTVAQGSIIIIAGKGVGGWALAQNSGQQVFFGAVSTTLGAGGSLSSSNRRDSISLVCITADTEFQIISSIGNITYV